MSAPYAPPPYPPPAAPPPEYGAGSIVLGLLLAIGGAAGVGISMVTQRYALSALTPTVRIWPCGRTTKFRAWFLGLAMYGVANGLQAGSLTLGPLFLMGGIFTLLLVFNLIFAKIILDEKVTKFKVAGACTIVVGVVMTVLAAPSEVKTEYSGEEIWNLASRAMGFTYLLVLVTLLIATVCAMVYMENHYPTEDLFLHRQREGTQLKDADRPVAARAVPLGILPDVLAISAELSSHPNSFRRDSDPLHHQHHHHHHHHHHSLTPTHRRVVSAPMSLEQIRHLAANIRETGHYQEAPHHTSSREGSYSTPQRGHLAPIPVGSSETIVEEDEEKEKPGRASTPHARNSRTVPHFGFRVRSQSATPTPKSPPPSPSAPDEILLATPQCEDASDDKVSLRSWMVMLSHGNLDGYGLWLMPLAATLWVFFSLATVVYVRLVFQRYETTRALPIEYGTVNVANFCSGLLYFDEGKDIEGWKLILGISGLMLLVSGIFISQLDEWLYVHEVEKRERESAASAASERPGETSNPNDVSCA